MNNALEIDLSKRKGVLKMTAIHLSKGPVKKVMKLSDFRLPLEYEIEGYHSVLYGHQNANKAAAIIHQYARANGLNVLSATILYDLGTPLPVGVVGSKNGIPMEETRFVNMTRLASDRVKEVADRYKRIVKDTLPSIADDSIESLYAWSRPHEFMPDCCALGVPMLFKEWDIDVLVHPVRFTMIPRNDFVFVASYKIDPKRVLSVEPNIWEIKGEMPDRILIE